MEQRLRMSCCVPQRHTLLELQRSWKSMRAAGSKYHPSNLVWKKINWLIHRYIKKRKLKNYKQQIKAVFLLLKQYRAKLILMKLCYLYRTSIESLKAWSHLHFKWQNFMVSSIHSNGIAAVRGFACGGQVRLNFDLPMPTTDLWQGVLVELTFECTKRVQNEGSYPS